MKNFRPKPFYFLNTSDPAAYTPDECRKSMQRLRDLGFGGCVLFNKPPCGFTEELYLTDRWLDALENFIIAGRELDLELWLNDGFNYPPGDAAGRIKKVAPHLGQQRLVLQADNKVEIKEVDWGFPAFELPESSELFIKFAYESMVPRLGKYFGNGLYGIFSDCDNRRYSPHAARTITGQVYYPWSDNFAETFKQQHNYDIVPLLPEVLSNRNEQALFDYWETSGYLYNQWFANNYQWCKNHNLKYTFHSSDTGPLDFASCPRTSVYSEGEPLRLLSFSDYPGTDHELALLDGGTHYDSRYKTPQKIWGTPGRAEWADFSNSYWDVRAKYAQSAAYMLKRSGSMCEMFAATNHGADYQLLRRIAAYQIMQGINFIVPHAVHHRFGGIIKYFAPPEFMYSSLHNGVKEFNDYLAEFCRIASQGEYLAEVAVIEPTKELFKGNAQAGKNLFAIFDILKNSACGYVAVTREYLEKNPGKFAMVIDPVTWDGTLDLTGITGNDVTFSGGKLALMRRKLADNTIMLIAANIWNDREVTGVLNFNNKEFNIALAPGEYAVFNAPWEHFRSPEKTQPLLELPETASISYSTVQRIPIEPDKTHEGSEFVFEWSNQSELPQLMLEVPVYYQNKICCDGVLLTQFENAEHWHEKVRCFPLPATALQTGKHTLTFEAGIDQKYIPFLAGEFDASAANLSEDTQLVRSTYCLALRRAGKYALELSPRRNTMQVGRLTGEQGALFYDGAITFKWEFELAEKASKIALPGTSGVCDIVLDGKAGKRIIFEPYTTDLEILPGKHTLEITLYGSEGALLEGGNAEVKLGKPMLIKAGC